MRSSLLDSSAVWQRHAGGHSQVAGRRFIDSPLLVHVNLGLLNKVFKAYLRINFFPLLPRPADLRGRVNWKHATRSEHTALRARTAAMVDVV